MLFSCLPTLYFFVTPMSPLRCHTWMSYRSVSSGKSTATWLNSFLPLLTTARHRHWQDYRPGLAYSSSCNNVLVCPALHLAILVVEEQATTTCSSRCRQHRRN